MSIYYYSNAIVLTLQFSTIATMLQETSISPESACIIHNPTANITDQQSCVERCAVVAGGVYRWSDESDHCQSVTTHSHTSPETEESQTS